MNWLTALRATLEHFKDRDPEWGAVDCMQLVAFYVEKMTGTNHALSFNYDSKAVAIRIMGECGGVVGLLSAHLGPQHDAEPGDVVAYEVEDGIAAGITNGPLVFSIHPEKGLIRYPFIKDRCYGAWPCRKQ